MSHTHSPLSFNGDIVNVLPLVTLGVPSAYGCYVNGLDKICGNHTWCNTKTIDIQNDFEFSFVRSSCVPHLPRPTDYCDYMHLSTYCILATTHVFVVFILSNPLHNLEGPDFSAYVNGKFDTTSQLG